MAQQRKPVQIDLVQVGFGATKLLSEFKFGAWTPVYIDVRAWEQGQVPEGLLVVESIDNDEVRSRYTVKLPRLEAKETLTVTAFTRPGATEITVSALQADGRPITSVQEDYHGLDLGQQLYLSLGSRLPSLRRALLPKPSQTTNDDDEIEGDKRDGPRRVASVDDVRMLPNRWFVYEAADLVILSTGNREGFLTDLLNEREGRKEALVEWVRRGGRLIVSVGVNQDMAGKLEFIQELLPVSIAGLGLADRLTSVRQWINSRAKEFEMPRSEDNPKAEVKKVEFAKLEPKPGRECEILVRERDGTPLVVRSAFGLGRVTVVALDFDRSPFKGWDGQREFWDRLVKTAAPPLPETPSNTFGTRMQGRPFPTQDSLDVASQLEMGLEEFEDVPVISFGWVALFILIYILVVGPLDYFFLKKVVKRLELTWITFPTVVITISVAAYFTAYWVKGNDQKINKVDLVDIDLHTHQMYGNSWFTIFSPRIQHYTVGLEPTEPGWAPAGAAARSQSSVLLTWLGRPDVGFGGSNRGQAQGLFRRAYDYATDATGLMGVPIQVWSTKSFTGAWQAPFSPAKPPVQADLRLKDRHISGTITSHLPVKLEDVALCLEGTWYPLESLIPDVPKRVDAIQGNSGQDMNQWITAVPSSYLRQSRGSRTGGGNAPPILTTIKRIMFYEKATGGLRDNTLSALDQGWRVSHQQEVMVFGRVARKEGAAEEVTAETGVPTRLWLGALPGASATRPPMSGTLAQETYVRIIIPVGK
jgi:hypothetical protein